MLIFSINVYADGSIYPERWPDGYLKSPNGYLTKANHIDQGCRKLDFDKELHFDISGIKDELGGYFDASKLRIDYATNGGHGVLEDRLDDDGGSFVVPLNHAAWANDKTVEICVGATIWPLHKKDLEQLFLWYDDPALLDFGRFIGSFVDSWKTMDCTGTDDGMVCWPQGHNPSTTSELYIGNGRTFARTTNPVYRQVATSKVATVTYSGRANGQTLRVMNVDIPSIRWGAGTANPQESYEDLPNFLIWWGSLWTDKDNGWESYTYKVTDTLYFRALIGNAGNGDIPNMDRVETRVFLSKGEKEDAHSKWVHVGTETTRGYHLEVWETHQEEIPVNKIQ